MSDGEIIGWRGETCEYCDTRGMNEVYEGKNKNGITIRYVRCSYCGEKYPLRGEL